LILCHALLAAPLPNTMPQNFFTADLGRTSRFETRKKPWPCYDAVGPARPRR
jgi:hypothetical protein